MLLFLINIKDFKMSLFLFEISKTLGRCVSTKKKISQLMWRRHPKLFNHSFSKKTVYNTRGQCLTKIFSSNAVRNEMKVKVKNYSKQKEKRNLKEEIEENWGGPEAFKLIMFLKDDIDVQIKKNKNILVFFSAKWCHHCRQLRKPFGMAALMSHEANLPMVFSTFDINYNPDLAQAKGVVGIPLIKYYSDGKFVTNYKGKRTSDELFEFAKNPPKITTVPHDKIDF